MNRARKLETLSVSASQRGIGFWSARTCLKNCGRGRGAPTRRPQVKNHDLEGPGFVRVTLRQWLTVYIKALWRCVGLCLSAVVERLFGDVK